MPPRHLPWNGTWNRSSNDSGRARLTCMASAISWVLEVALKEAVPRLLWRNPAEIEPKNLNITGFKARSL